MDPVRNPYSPGAGTPPPALVGRDEELRNVDVAIQRLALGRSARSVMLTGLRGVGKTVLLSRFGQLARDQGWSHQHLEATEDIDLAEAVATICRRAILGLSMGQRMADRTRRALGVLRSLQIRWGIPEWGAVLEVEPFAGLADSGKLDDDLADLFIEVGTLAHEQSSGVLFTVDEIQYLDRTQLAAFIVGLHRISQRQLPLMVVGAGLPSLPSLASEARSYAERLFQFATIGSLPDAEASDALQSPARDEGVRWSSNALHLAVEQSEGYPYFLQEFGKQSWDAAEGPHLIRAEDVETAIPVAIDELDIGFFAARFDRTTPGEREYLSAMALFGKGPYQSGEVAGSLGKRTNQVGPVRDSLIKRGLCYSPSHNVIDFTVPMFDQFVRRRLG